MSERRLILPGKKKKTHTDRNHRERDTNITAKGTLSLLSKMGPA